MCLSQYTSNNYLASQFIMGRLFLVPLLLGSLFLSAIQGSPRIVLDIDANLILDSWAWLTSSMFVTSKKLIKLTKFFSMQELYALYQPKSVCPIPTEKYLSRLNQIAYHIPPKVTHPAPTEIKFNHSRTCKKINQVWPKVSKVLSTPYENNESTKGKSSFQVLKINEKSIIRDNLVPHL